MLYTLKNDTLTVQVNSFGECNGGGRSWRGGHRFSFSESVFSFGKRDLTELGHGRPKSSCLEGTLVNPRHDKMRKSSDINH